MDNVPLKDTTTRIRLVAPQAIYISLEGCEFLRVLDNECPLIENVVMMGSKEREELVMSVDQKIVILLLHHITCALN